MFRAPKSGQMPSLLQLRDDLWTRDPARIADHLGITERTLRRYVADGQAPRAVLLALFWETRWGVETINCEALNDAIRARGMASALEQRVALLSGRIARLEALGDFGAANL